MDYYCQFGPLNKIEVFYLLDFELHSHYIIYKGLIGLFPYFIIIMRTSVLRYFPNFSLSGECFCRPVSLYLEENQLSDFLKHR